MQANWDDSQFDTDGMSEEAENELSEGVHQAGDTLLEISVEEVPFDESTLSKSGKVDNSEALKSEVSFDTPYAHRLHEHPDYNFQNGRKGKYLEDPLKLNFQNFMDTISNKLKALTNG